MWYNSTLKSDGYGNTFFKPDLIPPEDKHVILFAFIDAKKWVTVE
jgi:hypothetical protein